MSNSNKPQVDIHVQPNMSLGQQMAHARRQGADSFITPEGRLYILEKGKWKLVKQKPQDFEKRLDIARHLGPEYVQAAMYMAAQNGHNFNV